MVERGGDTPEMISDSSIDDDSVVRISRPKNKRSTVVDDESISDSSNDRDSDLDELANADNPKDKDDVNAGLGLNTDHFSSMSAFDDYLESADHATSDRKKSDTVKSDTNNSSSGSMRKGPFSLVPSEKGVLSTKPAPIDRVGPFASAQLRPCSTLQSETSVQPVSLSSSGPKSVLSCPSVVTAAVTEPHPKSAVTEPHRFLTIPTPVIMPATVISLAQAAPIIYPLEIVQVAKAPVIAKAVVAPTKIKTTTITGTATMPMKPVMPAVPTITRPNPSIAPKLPNKAATKPAILTKATLISTTATTGAAQPTLSVRARSGSVDLTLEKLQSGSDKSIVSHNYSSSSGQSGTIRSVIRSNSSNTKEEEKESAERWRDRLWPSRALTSFCRSITRCIPPVLEPGKNIFSGCNSRDGEKKIRLDPHWDKTDLRKVLTSYDTLAAHNAAFFLLLVEESRESSVQDSSEFEASVSTISMNRLDTLIVSYIIRYFMYFIIYPFLGCSKAK